TLVVGLVDPVDRAHDAGQALLAVLVEDAAHVRGEDVQQLGRPLQDPGRDLVVPLDHRQRVPDRYLVERAAQVGVTGRDGPRHQRLLCKPRHEMTRRVSPVASGADTDRVVVPSPNGAGREPRARRPAARAPFTRTLLCRGSVTHTSTSPAVSPSGTSSRSPLSPVISTEDAGPVTVIVG